MSTSDIIYTFFSFFNFIILVLNKFLFIFTFIVNLLKLTFIFKNIFN